MGMDLSISYLLLDKEQYNKLKNKELYIKSNYELELVSAIEAEEHKKSVMFDEIAYYLDNLLENSNTKEINIKIKNENNSNFNLESFIKENLPLEEELPITLDEFLNYDYCGEWVINELHEEFVNDKDCYLLIQARYW